MVAAAATESAAAVDFCNKSVTFCVLDQSPCFYRHFEMRLTFVGPLVPKL